MTALLEAPALEVPDEVEADIRLTVDEFLALDEVDGDEEFYDNYELIRGKIVPKRKPNPSGRHSEIIGNLTFAIKSFVAAQDENKRGRVFPEGPVRIAEDDYFIPDLAYVAAGRIQEEDFEGVIPVFPDLVMEVNSPSDTQKQIYDKIEDYLKAGVRLIWSVYMLHKFVTVHKPGGGVVEVLDFNEELDGEEVLPGFKMKVRDLFK